MPCNLHVRFAGFHIDNSDAVIFRVHRKFVNGLITLVVPFHFPLLCQVLNNPYRKYSIPPFIKIHAGNTAFAPKFPPFCAVVKAAVLPALLDILVDVAKHAVVFHVYQVPCKVMLHIPVFLLAAIVAGCFFRQDDAAFLGVVKIFQDICVFQGHPQDFHIPIVTVL